MAMIGKKPYDPNASVNLPAATPPQSLAGPQLAAQDIPVPQHQNFFGQGGIGRSIAGSIGDALLQLGHMAPIYAPVRAAQTAFERGEQSYNARQQSELQRQMEMYKFQMDNPNDEVTQLIRQMGIDPHSPQAAAYYGMALQQKTNPIQAIMVDDGQGGQTRQFYRAPTPPLPQVVTGLPPGAVPLSLPVQGGPTPPASGVFPRARRK